MCDFGEYQIADMFSHSGHLRKGFTKIDSFNPFEGGKNFFADAKEYTKADILDLLKKDPLTSPQTIANVLDKSREWVARNIAEMVKGGVIEQVENAEGSIIREPLPSADEILKKLPPPKTTEILLRYSYQKRPIANGPAVIPTTRTFCRQMMKLSDSGRVYTRQDIELISARLGYNVFERAGGFWGSDKQCRHFFEAEILLKKS